MMADPGLFRVPHHVWQRANVNAAATYLREVLAADPANTRVKALHDGLLDVLDPTRRFARQQRELARTKIPMSERRRSDRRAGSERRQTNDAVPAGTDRRSRGDRRSGRDRRMP
jgi:hypothetical protein